ncbi:MAG: MerR family transcriptional regulator [Candidatus Omnitrophota bacterium]
MNKKYYSTREVLKKVGISRNTIFLWFKYRKVPEVQRDRNGHRIFTEKDIQLILNYKNKTIPPKEIRIGKG